MALSQDQIKELKSQLLKQIEHLPHAKKAEAEAQINDLSEDALESMLEEQQSSSAKVFRLIIDGKIPSVKLSENEKAISVLSTKSISKGHTIIIPKSPVYNEKDLPKEAHDLSEQVSKKLINSLNAKSTSIGTEKSFGEVIIHVIPIYDKPVNLNSPRQDISLEDLEKLKLEINVEKIERKPEKIKIEKPKETEILKLKRRIP